jgi:hypothetical protein
MCDHKTITRCVTFGKPADKVVADRYTNLRQSTSIQLQKGLTEWATTGRIAVESDLHNIASVDVYVSAGQRLCTSPVRLRTSAYRQVGRRSFFLARTLFLHCTRMKTINPNTIDEEKHNIPTRSLSFYLVLLFAVAPIWLIIPICWVFVIHSLRSGWIWIFSWQGWICFAVALCEVCSSSSFSYPYLCNGQVLFSLHHYLLARRVSGPSPYGPGNLGELRIAFMRVLRAGFSDQPENGSLPMKPHAKSHLIEQLEYDDPRAVDFRNVLRTWFGRAPWSSIRRHEIYAWLYWCIFNAPLPPPDSLPHLHHLILEETLDLLQKRTGCIIPEGSAPHIKPMCLTLDKVNVYWRPLMWYVSVTFINWLARTWFEHQHNIRYGSHKGLE